MGCWNQTCGLSQMPIRAGDPVVAVVLRRNGDFNGANGCCYADDLWAPTGLPLYGEYDDYGMITSIDDESAGGRILIRWAERAGIKGDKGDNHWPGVADQIIQKIDDTSREARHTKDWKYSIMMFARPIYEAALDAVAKTNGWSGNTRHLLNQSIMEYLGTVVKARQSGEELGVMSARWSGDLYYYLQSNRANDEIFNAIEDAPLTFTAATLELMLLKSALQWSRKFFTPQSGQGSQDGDTDVQIAIAHAMIQHDLDTKRRWKEEYGDDEDDDSDDE